MRRLKINKDNLQYKIKTVPKLYKHILAFLLVVIIIFLSIPTKAQAATATVKSTKGVKYQIQKAVDKKAGSLLFKISNFSTSKYSNDILQKLIEECEINTVKKSGYLFNYKFSISYSGSMAALQFGFNYVDVSDFDSKNLITITKETLLKAKLESAAKNRTEQLNFVFWNYRGTSYTNLIQKINTSLKSEGYSMKINSTKGFGFGNLKFISLGLSYEAFDGSSLNVFSDYDGLYSYLDKQTQNKRSNIKFTIKNYDPKEFYVGEVFYNIDLKSGAKRGYRTQLVNITAKEQSKNMTFEYDLSYPEYNAKADLSKDGLIMKSSKDWYLRAYDCIKNLKFDIGVNMLYSYPYSNEVLDALSYHPEYNFDYSVLRSSSGKINLDSTFSESGIRSMMEAVNTKSDEIIKKIITGNMTDAEKARAIHDYIIKNCEYDSENYNKNAIPLESFFAYGVIINQVAVCQGYAGAFNLLASKAGLKSIAVSGDAKGPHAWNYVSLDGKNVYIDCTWDDPVYTSGSKPDSISTKYFAVSEEELSKDHTWDSKGLNTYLAYSK